MKRLTNILLFLLLSITAFAQRAPITVTTILTPPYTTSLSTMAESGSTRLMVNLLVNDVTITEIPVKLHIKMESAGITIESIPTQAVRPMFLGGGEARVLTGDDFAEYLRLDNLNFKGFSKEAYIKNGQLPAGLWKFSVSVRHFYTNKTISNIGTVTAWITSYKPPVLTTPKEGEIAPSNAALPLTFSWQASKHTGGTAAIMYRFEMWERRIDGVPAQAVAASVPPIYTTETAGLTATVLPATLALEPGMKYCWRVTAYDPSGMVTIENKGESEVRTFQYLEKCPEVCGLTVDIKDDTGYASWEENRMHLGGYNFEFYDDEGTCHKTLWGSSTKTAGIGGEYGKTWHVRVQGLCRSGVEGPWSDWVDFKIPDAFKPLKDENGNTYECGREVPERVITNFELIDNIQKGDTLEDERGTTKYIVHSAIKNEDGSFRGLSYMKLSFWGVKVLGEYNNMKVNTDGVIIGRYAWKSVKSDLLVADPEAIEKWADELALEMAGATYNNTIKDTIVLKYSKGYVRFETIRREGDKYFAVTSDNKDVEITSMINGKTRALVQDGDGHELVIDKDGNVMGVEEYKKCGGSKALLRENIKEKDSQVTKSGNVKFFSAGDYLFDTYDNYSGKTGYAERFPSIGEGDYRPAYACAESNTKIEIKAEPYANITFKNERGVPLICKGGILEVTARGDRDTTSIYAYDAENHIVGKVNVLSYDKQTRKICLVPIGDTKVPDASAVKQGLDEIFAKLMMDFDVTIGEPITIQYAKNNIFTHGGSGMIGVYNTDQKAAISKLKERGIDNETVYLFLAECSINNQLDENDKIQVVNGYMPRGYQFGFIYNEFNNYRTDAHEICHGAFHLKHTFAQDDFLAAERTTDNLMDYNDGKTLNHWQWKDIHQPKSVRFKWLQEEEGAEAWGEGTRYKCISTELATKIKSKYRYFYYPDGSIVDMKDYLPSGFYLSNDVDAKTSYGTVATIREGDKDLYYVFDHDTHQNEGYGYSLGGKTVLLYNIPPISNPNLDELNPVYVYIEGNNIRTVDSHGEEMTYDNSVCDCNMAKYRELTPDMLISEVNEPLSKAPRMFYDPKTNEIIFVTEVHDLKWFRVAEDGPQYDLESLKAQGAKCHYYTEAELANTHYNQLRTDVQTAMNEGGKVVMIGLAATIAAPYLIEYAAAYGEQALVQLAKKAGEKAVQELIKKGINQFIKKCAKDEVKDDAKAFIRGAVSQFLISSIIWAVEETENGHKVGADTYASLLGLNGDSEILNSKYGNKTRDFWMNVLQAGLTSFLDKFLDRYSKTHSIAIDKCIVTYLEDLDYSRIISAFGDESKSIEFAFERVLLEVAEKVLPSAIDCGWKYAQEEMGVSKLDSHVKEYIGSVIIDVIGRIGTNGVYSLERSIINDK